MKKMMVVLALAVLPLMGHANVIGERLIRLPKIVVHRGDLKPSKTVAMGDHAMKRFITKTAKSARLKKIERTQLPREEAAAESAKQNLEMDQQTFYRQYAKAHRLKAYNINPDRETEFLPEYNNYVMTRNACQEYVDRFMQRFNQEKDVNITLYEVREWLDEVARIQIELRTYIGTSMGVVDEALMEMDDALTEIHRLLSTMNESSGEVLPLSRDPRNFAEELEQRLGRGVGVTR